MGNRCRYGPLALTRTTRGGARRSRECRTTSRSHLGPTRNSSLWVRAPSCTSRSTERCRASRTSCTPTQVRSTPVRSTCSGARPGRFWTTPTIGMPGRSRTGSGAATSRARSAAPDAWRRVTAGEGTGDSGLARVLGASGPVPWAIKEPLLRELARDSRWHGAIFEAIHASRHDIYGSVELRRALELLKSLRPGGVDRASVADLVTALKGK